MFSLSGRTFTDTHCLIIGEVAQAHDGSLGMAHAFIDAIAKAGADAIKFQTHIAQAESTPAEPWRVKFSQQDKTRYEYWERMEFTEEQWKGLKQHAEEKKLIFLSSPFSMEAVELLERLDMVAWKIASGEVSNHSMLERIAKTGRLLLLSTGMSPLSEIDAVVQQIKEYESPFALLHCSSVYPCPPEKVGLNVIPYFRERYGCAVGLSDHSGTIYAGLAAITLGITVLEVHVTLSREMFGPDVPVSLTTSELHQLVEGARFIEKIRAHPVDKDGLARQTMPLRHLFTKSLVARGDIAAGTILREEHLAAKKPGTGIPANEAEKVIGRRLRQNITTNHLLSEDDLEEVE
jgi:N-acetylneuraminate synthase